MSALVGTGRLIRFILKRDRKRLLVWLVTLALLPLVTANAFFVLTPTEADRAAMAATAVANPAFLAILGPIFGNTIGALTAWRIATIGAVLVGLMAIFTVVRHTREEEESGRAELVGSAVVGRLALPVAAVTVVSLFGLVLAVAVAGGLAGLGLETAGAGAFGLGYGLVALAFAGVGALAAQFPEGAGAARGIGVGVLGISFLLRAVGDSTDLTFLRWLSPIGWLSQLRAFAAERWWVLGLFGALAVVTAGLALFLVSSRDVGAGLFAPRRGPARAASTLRSPLALARRLHRPAFVGWTVGLAAIGVVYGSIADSIGDLLTQNPQLALIFERLGGEKGVTDVFFATAMGILALIAAAYATRTSLRLRTEEENKRADPMLATATPRARWMGSHVAIAFLGSAAMLLLSGVATGATYGVISGDPGGQIARVAQAALLQVPAVWVMAGVAALLYGFSPRLTQASWGALVIFLVFGQLGSILQLPQWLLNLSPFTHVPSLPVESIDPAPIIWLMVLTIFLAAAGFVGFQRRDLA